MYWGYKYFYTFESTKYCMIPSNRYNIMKNIYNILFLFIGWSSFAQVDTQTRFTSDSRQYYVWNDDRNSYELRETEHEHSLIEIREVGSKSAGYIVISLTDGGQSRIYHGSITAFANNDMNEGVWSMRSKTLQGRLTYNAEKHTVTYTYEANDKRYNKILVFTLRPLDS